MENLATLFQPLEQLGMKQLKGLLVVIDGQIFESRKSSLNDQHIDPVLTLQLLADLANQFVYAFGDLLITQAV